MKIKKGDYGYLMHQRKIEILKTIVLFAISIAIYAAGYISAGSRENLFTVVAVLGMLPASKSAVSMIMFLRFQTGSREVFEKVSGIIGNIPVFYDSVITTTQKSYPLNVFFCYAGNLCGYTEKPDTDTKTVEKHIKEMLRNNQMSDVTIKLYTDLNAYLARIESVKNIDLLKSDGEKTSKDEQVIALVRAISL